MTPLYVKLGIILLIVGMGVTFSLVQLKKVNKAERKAFLLEFLISMYTTVKDAVSGDNSEQKMKNIYTEFSDSFPTMASGITFEQFSELVTNILDEVNELLPQQEGEDNGESLG